MRLIISLVFLAVATLPPLAAQECRPQKTALVLSGGGVKGLAHVGVLHVLDSLRFRPDLIVGTSIGAIVGAMYASGYSARQIDSLARALPIAELVRPFRHPTPHPWGHRIPLLSIIRGQRGFTLQTGVVDESAPNARLNVAMLRGNLLARGRFDQLPIPFLAIATDARDRSTVVISGGDLAQAVRASSSIPLVFPPVVSGQAILVDGGLSANIPVEQARAAGAERVIVVDVTEHPARTLDPESPVELADQMIGFLFHQPAARLGPGDIGVRPAVDRYRSLDFSPETVAEVLRQGRIAADTTVGRATCLSPSHRPDPTVLPPILSGWTVRPGASRSDSLLLERMLGFTPGRIDPAELGKRLIRLGTAEGLRGAWLNPTGGPDTVRFNLEPIHAPRMVGGVGVAYDHEQGGQAWAGLFDRHIFGTPLEGSALISVGRFVRELSGSALWHADVGWSPITPVTTIQLRAEDIRRFDPLGDELEALPTRAARLTAGAELRAAEAWRVRAAADVFGWDQPGQPARSRIGGSVRVERSGRDGLEVQSEILMNRAFQSAELTAAWPVVRRRWSVRPGVRLGWGDDLPPQWTFALGGAEGFPGLHIGELRGSREISGSVRFGYAIAGPVQVRASLAGGRAWTASPTGSWQVGTRLGLGVDTPAGPIDAAYGVTFSGRGALYIRVGKWF